MTNLKALKEVKVNFNIRDYKTTNKTTLINCIIRYNNISPIVISGVGKVEPRYWNQKTQSARSNQLNSKGEYINEVLAGIKNDIENVFNDFKKANKAYPDRDSFKQQCLRVINKEKDETSISYSDIIPFAKKFIADTTSGVRLNPATGKPIGSGTVRIYNNVVKAIEDFKQARRFNTGLDNINLDFYSEFTDYLKFEKKFATNSIAKYIKTIKTFMNDARDRGFTNNSQFKSKRFKVITEDTDTVYLNAKELNSIDELDLKDNPRLERVRDLFLVGCWSGLRFSDYKDISPKNISGDFMTIKAIKTQKEVVIPIHETIRAIMAKYKDLTDNSLPPTISNVKMNEYLKEVAKEAKLNEIIEVKFTKAGQTIIKNVPKYTLITTHTARRSFATNMYLLGIPTITIMAITGHRTEKAFMRYIRVTPDEHAQNMLAIWRRTALKAVV
jgi:integrase